MAQRVSHERVEEQRVQMLEHEKQVAQFRDCTALLEGSGQDNHLGVTKLGGNVVGDFLINVRPSAQTPAIRTFLNLRSPPPSRAVTKTIAEGVVNCLISPKANIRLTIPSAHVLAAPRRRFQRRRRPAPADILRCHQTLLDQHLPLLPLQAAGPSPATPRLLYGTKDYVLAP
ncbi:uncharacterized protein BXZ73DRAFT_101979 [Epithele typhae]|uniref:uncharacterized protein n=1 Tax=Epithele typhae TaxID=378194 RepID=UPI002007A471|nr:uncharacterized protein BXZ73DRAFT_101979 [Epithele typhae]KAH9929915.1 hypothetical protein BXZ73DRAFT_101979 [Epithele typhae]